MSRKRRSFGVTFKTKVALTACRAERATLVFMTIREAAKKWTMPIHHWKQALNHFAICYQDRMSQLANP